MFVSKDINGPLIIWLVNVPYSCQIVKRIMNRSRGQIELNRNANRKIFSYFLI